MMWDSQFEIISLSVLISFSYVPVPGRN